MGEQREKAEAGHAAASGMVSAPVGLIGKVLRETLTFSGLQLVGQVFLWGSNLVLARLLSPRDFGTYDICMFFLAVGSMMGDAGLGAALLRTPKQPRHEQYAVVFYVNLVSSGLLGLALAIASPWLVSAYGLQNSSRWILIVMAPVYLLSTLRTMPQIRLERDLRFGAIAGVELAVLFIKQTAAVILAALGFQVWALVLAAILASLLTVAGLLRIQPFLPRPRWALPVLKPLLLFGIKVQALGFVAFFKDNVSNALLGVLAGAAVVGLFNFGMRYIQTPILAVNALARVQLPVYARLQQDPQALGRTVCGALRLSFVLGVPMLVVLASNSNFLVPLLYSARWGDSIPVIWALLPNMVGSLAASPLFTLLQARNEAGVALVTFAGWTLATWALSALAWYLGLGTAGVGAAHSLATVVVTLVLLLRAQQALNTPFVREIAPPVLAGTLAVGAWVAVAHAAGWVGRVGRHPVTSLTLPLVIFVLVEFVLERQKLVGEIRGLVSSARGRAP
jgi:O-antigen/teichoic acid export membrane protein